MIYTCIYRHPESNTGMHGVIYPSISQSIVSDVVFLTPSNMTELRKQKKNMQNVAQEIPNLILIVFFDELLYQLLNITRKQQSVYVFIIKLFQISSNISIYLDSDLDPDPGVSN